MFSFCLKLSYPKDELIGNSMSNISTVDTTPHAISVSPEMGDFLQQLHRDQTELEKKLLKDTTRTKSAKKMFAAEAGQKRLDMALKRAERAQQDIAADLSKYDTRIENLMKVRGTTDLLIMQNYATALADKKPSEIMALNDIDALRACLLVPTMKINEGVVKQQDTIRAEAEKMILADDYEQRQQLKEKLKAAELLEVGLLKTHGEYSKDIKAVKSNMVTDDGIEPVVG
jgi:hypothetical protein